MAAELAGLLIVNLAYALVGLAVLVLPGWVTRDPDTWYRTGAAYPVGIVAIVVPASYLALVRVPVSLTATVVGVVLVAAALWRSKPWRSKPRSRIRLRGPGKGSFVARLIGLVIAVILLYALRTFATRPFLEWDSWVVWMSKARLLYEAPSAAPAALRSGDYGQAPYPLGLPTLESLGFSAMGRFDGTVIGVQFLLLAMTFPITLWSLLRARARPWTIALASLTVVCAPQILYQLLTRYADVPLGLFVGLGLAAGAAWAVSRRSERWLLGCFVLFLGMAGLLKSEGLLFALAGCIALAATTVAERNRARLVEAAVAIGGVLAIVVPWRVYCSAYGLATPDYDLGNALRPSYLQDHADRVWPTVTELSAQLTNAKSWGFLVWAILLALLAGVCSARWRLLAFAGTWLVLAAGGLLLTYWVSVLPLTSHLTNTSNRTIVSLLVGGAAMMPLFVFPRPDPSDR
jgi:hypothetical protein